jgi:hypothetical protein
MNLYEALVPAAIANAGVLATFFDGRVISVKVKDELSASSLTAAQRARIEEICRGVSSMFGFFGNIAIVLATAIFALDFVPPEWRKFANGFFAVTVIVLIAGIIQIAVMRLSNIDERVLFRIGRLLIKPSTALKILLIIMNTVVFVEMASGIP